MSITKAYIDSGHELLMVRKIDQLRGGNYFITTSINSYYMDFKSKKLYNDYPLIEKNEVTDKVELNYLSERISTYIDRMKEEVERLTNAFL